MEAPEYFQYHVCSELVNESHHSSDTMTAGGSDNFMVEELLDFSNDDVPMADENGSIDYLNDSSTDSSTVTFVDSSILPFSGYEPETFPGDCAADVPFSSDLCVAYDDLAELEWLSNFSEESFSSEDLQKLQLISGMSAVQAEDPGRNSPTFQPDKSVPAKARSKRSRGAPCIWTSRIPLLSPTSSSSELNVFTPVAPNSTRKASRSSARTEDGQKCLHCATDQTPQWRTGPMGPKTLCNACGVRYKSGRLAPEYRPAGSPTFVLTKHSNSHRKVMELRRQKEMTNILFDASNGEEYLIELNVGPNFSHLI